jgi:hypothetical protein
VCPGLIATDIVNRGYFVDESVRAATAQAFEKAGHPPELVARAIMNAIATNAAMVPVGAEAWAFYWGKRVAPSLVGRLRRRFEASGRN